MRLLDTSTLELRQFNDSRVPRYAILSHTWGGEEVTLDDMRSNQTAIHTLQGFQKITRFCLQEQKLGFAYGWVDTRCT